MTFQISSAILGLSSEGPGHFSSLAHLFLCVVRALKHTRCGQRARAGWGQAFRGALLEHLLGPGPPLPFLGRSGALHQCDPPTPALHSCHGNPVSLHRVHTPAGRNAERKEGCIVGRGEGAGCRRGHVRGGPAAGLAELKRRCASHMACPAQSGAGTVPGDETMVGEGSQDCGHMPLSFWQSATASLKS